MELVTETATGSAIDRLSTATHVSPIWYGAKKIYIPCAKSDTGAVNYAMLPRTSKVTSVISRKFLEEAIQKVSKTDLKQFKMKKEKQ